MFKLANPFFMITETPLHAGSGNDLGIVDMPIQRERHTGYPKIESSGIKGSLREAFSKHNGRIKVGSAYVTQQDIKEAVNIVFGPDELKDNSEDAYASALGFTDARLLLFPVKSMKGVFAWVTSPEVLKRFVKDLYFCGVKDLPEVPKEKTVPHKSGLIIKDNKIVLEEYAFDVQPDGEKGKCTKLANWLADHVWPKNTQKDAQPGDSQDGTQQKDDDRFDYWREKMCTDIVVLDNDAFCDFVSLSTEIITRTKINTATGTVERGALFTEEYLPSDTILYSLALASSILGKTGKAKGVFEQVGKAQEDLVMEFFKNALPPVVQMGGNATIGKGFVRLNVGEVK